MWSYDAELSTERDQIRFLIQDTTSTRQLFQDEEIDWRITQEMNIYMAAAALAEALVARARAVKYKKIGEFAISYDNQMYKTLANSLRARGLNYQVPYAGGISAADKAAQQADSDWIAPKIQRGQGDNPSAPQPSVPPINPLDTI